MSKEIPDDQIQPGEPDIETSESPAVILERVDGMSWRTFGYGVLAGGLVIGLTIAKIHQNIIAEVNEACEKREAAALTAQEKVFNGEFERRLQTLTAIQDGENMALKKSNNSLETQSDLERKLTECLSKVAECNSKVADCFEGRAEAEKERARCNKEKTGMAEKFTSSLKSE